MEGANSTTCAQPGYDQGFKMVVHKCNRINSQNGGGGSGGGDFGGGIFNFAEGRPAWRNEHGSAWKRMEGDSFHNAGGITRIQFGKWRKCMMGAGTAKLQARCNKMPH